jgi:hypothetical protein
MVSAPSSSFFVPLFVLLNYSNYERRVKKKILSLIEFYLGPSVPIHPLSLSLHLNPFFNSELRHLRRLVFFA